MVTRPNIDSKRKEGAKKASNHTTPPNTDDEWSNGGSLARIPMTSKIRADRDQARVACCRSGKNRIEMCGHRRCLCLERFWEFANHRIEEKSEPKAAFYTMDRWEWDIADGLLTLAVSTNDGRFEWTPHLLYG